MKFLTTNVRAFVRDEEGAALAEYGLLVALIAVVCVVVIATFGTKISTAFATINGKLP